jgi:hypothetical protein
MQWSQIDIPAPLQVSASLGGMVVGLALLVAGYRLWKYTIFMIGFVIFGASIGFAVFAASSADCALCQAATLVIDADAEACSSLQPLGVCTELYLKSAGAGIAAGLVGGIFFLCAYFVVLCCFGCYTGMAGWVVSATLVLAITATNGSFTDFAELILVHGPTVGYVVGLGALVAGIICACLFVKFEDVAIKIGTSYMGAQLLCMAFVQGLLGDQMDSRADAITLTAVTWIVTAVGFYIQHYHTSRWMELDGCSPTYGENPKIKQGVVIFAEQGEPSEREPLFPGWPVSKV